MTVTGLLSHQWIVGSGSMVKYLPLSARRGRDTERGFPQLLEILPKRRRAVHGSTSSPRTLAATYRTNSARNVTPSPYAIPSTFSVSAPSAVNPPVVTTKAMARAPTQERHPVPLRNTFYFLRLCALSALCGESSPLEHLPNLKRKISSHYHERITGARYSSEAWPFEAPRICFA